MWHETWDWLSRWDSVQANVRFGTWWLTIVCVCVCVRLFLEKSQLEYSEEENDILGQGGSGTIIYRARYSNQPVAIKRFHFKKCQHQAISETGREAFQSFEYIDFNKIKTSEILHWIFGKQMMENIAGHPMTWSCHNTSLTIKCFCHF